MNATQVNETKAELQEAWRSQWRKHNKKGTLAGATGIGKTKPAIDEMMELWKQWREAEKMADDGSPMAPYVSSPKIFLGVPTETLRDTNWPDEVAAWYGDEGLEMWKTCVQAECYASMHKVQGKSFHLVVLDEIHNITLSSARFFESNLCISVMGMTATPPDANRDLEKYQIVKKHCPVIFSYTLDQGVDDGVVADFEINVIMSPLDTKTKNIEAGKKGARFYTTEDAHYAYLLKQVKKLNSAAYLPGALPNMSERAMFATFALNRFIYNLPSKTTLAKKILESVRTDKRTIIFCGSIAQANELGGIKVYHSKCKTKEKEYYKEFKAGEHDIIAVVKSVNEGENIVNLDQALVVQVDSNERNLVQRIGRTVRIREGHKAVIWIICAQGSADEKWVEKALTNFDTTKIRYFSSKEFD